MPKFSEFVGSLSLDVIGGSEKIPLVDTTPRYVTPGTLLTYVNTQQIAAASVTPTTGDVLHGHRSNTLQTFTLDAVSDYAIGRAFDSTIVTSITSGDLVVIERSGVSKTITVNDLRTYMQDSIQNSVLDLSGLGAATLGATDLLVVCQTSTPKKVALSDLETKLWSDFATYVGGITQNSTAADGDVFYSIQSGTPKYVTASTLATYFTAEIKDAVIATAWTGGVVNPALSTDVLVCQRSSVQKTLTVDTVSNYVLAVLGASVNVGPVSPSDQFVIYRNSAAKATSISNIVDYVLAKAWVQTTVGTVNTGDSIAIGRSGISKTTTVDALQSFVLTGIQATVLDASGLSAATLGASDEYLVVQSGVAKKTTLTGLETKLNTDFATYVAALSDTGTLLSTDKFYILNSGTPKYCTAAEIATFASAALWAASGASSVAGTDTFLVDQSGTKKEATLSQLQTFLAIGLQSSVLDISGLSAATVTGTDELLVCQSGSPKQATVDVVGAIVLTGTAAYIETLDQATLADTDKMFVSQGSIARMTALSELADYVVGATTSPLWTAVSATKYTPTPASTSSVTFNDTTDLAVGKPVRYTYNGTTYYGIVSSIASNASITISGAPLDVGHDITALAVGAPSQLLIMDLTVPGIYADNTEDILQGTANRYIRWKKSLAHLVGFSATHKTADTGASQPKLNVKVDGNLVSTQDSNAGLQLSTAGAWVDGSAVAIAVGNYSVSFNSALDLRVTAAGTNLDAANLSVSLIFVLE